MNGFGKVLLGLFFFILTLLVLGYASVFILLNDHSLRDLHDNVPGLSYIGSFLGIFDTSYQQDEIYKMKKDIGSNLEGFVKRKQSGISSVTEGGNKLSLHDERNEIALYSPYWRFSGMVTSGIESLQLIYSHKGRDVTRVFDIPFKPYDELIERSYEVHLGKETLYNGENEYLIEATFADGRVLSRKITLQVEYERIALDETIMYIDTSYIPEDDTEDILWEATDFEGETANFMTYGCDPEKPKPGLLIQRSYQYTTIPACLTFSTEKNYLLWFAFKERTPSAYLYDIISPIKGILYNKYPLFTYELHSTFFTLVFRDVRTQWLKFLSAKGDTLSYALSLLYYDVQKEKKVFSLTHVDGAQLIVENAKEKMLVYMYKQRDNFKSLTFPGVRYQFWYSRQLINQGMMYTLPLRLYGPQQSYAPTFTFDITLDDTRLYINDGIKRMSFDVLAIGKTIQVEPVSHPLDQPRACDAAQVEIYQNTRGDAIANAVPEDTLWMVGKGLHVSSIKLFHNQKRTPISVEQFYQGWFHYRMNPEKGTLHPGKNTYMIVAYDDRGRELCRIAKHIDIQEDK